MRLLLLDYISYLGHRNFNTVQVNALIKIGYDICLVGRTGQFENIKKKDNVSSVEIPEVFFKKWPKGAVFFRLQGIMILLWVKEHIRWRDYDAVLVLTYDIMSIFIFRISTRTFLINHNNVSQLSNKIKLCLTRHLPNNYSHIALNDEMYRRLKELLPGRDVYYVPHGICPPSNKIRKPSFILDMGRFLFCPVNNNYDPLFVKKIFEDRTFLDYLKSSGIVLYVKESLGVGCDGCNVKKVPTTMKEEEYNFMLKNALAVLLPYCEFFKYRCSGIFFECVSFGTPVIVTKLATFDFYKNMVEMKTFSDVVSLICAIKYYSDEKKIMHDLSLFDPTCYWKTVIERS